MKALGLVVLDIFFFPILSLRELMTPGVGAIFDPMGMIRRIYVKLHITMLVVSEKFFSVFPIISLWQMMTSPGSGLYGPQGHG